MARRFQSRRPQSQRRATEWFGGISTAFNSTVLAAGVKAIVTQIDTRLAATNPRVPFTIIRVRGLLAVGATSGAAGVFPHGAFGIAVVNGESFDGGIGTIPSPGNESADDRWLYHTYFAMPGNLVTITANLVANTQVTIDSRAKRKVTSGDVVVFVIENLSNVDGFEFVFNARTLLMVH